MILICSLPFIILAYVVFKNINASKQNTKEKKDDTDLSTTRRNSVQQKFLSNSVKDDDDGPDDSGGKEKNSKKKNIKRLKKAAKLTMAMLIKFAKLVLSLVMTLITLLASLGFITILIVLLIVIILTAVVYIFFLTDENIDFGSGVIKPGKKDLPSEATSSTTTPYNTNLSGSIGTYTFAPSVDSREVINMDDAATWNLMSNGRFSSYEEANQAVVDELAAKGLEFNNDNLKLTDEYAFWYGQLVTIEVPTWAFADTTNSAKVPKTVKVEVNKALAPYFTDFLTDLYNCSNQYVIQEIGGFNFRGKNTNHGYVAKLSGHSFGATLDINWTTDGMGLGDVPFQYALDLMEPARSRVCAVDSPWNSLVQLYGLDWGGNWSQGSLDPMHFSLVGDHLRAGRNFSTKVTTRNNIINTGGTNYASSANSSILLVGDSRTVGIATARNSTGRGDNEVAGVISDSNAYVKAKTSEGLTYMKNECVPFIEANIDANSQSTWFVTSWMGVNDLNVNGYIEIYDALLSKYENMYLFLPTIGMVDESHYHGPATNANISNFNETLKNYYSSNPRVVIIDVFNQQQQDVTGYSTDGLHYTSDGYNYVYNMLLTAWNNKGSAVVPKYEGEGAYYEGEILHGEGYVHLVLKHLCQGWYPDTRGSGGSTIAKSGCIDTSVAMILTFLTKHEVDVHTVSAYVDSNNSLATSTVLGQYGYRYVETHDLNEAMNQINQGKPVLVHMKGYWQGADGTMWHNTPNQHWMALCGYNPDGYIVNDPARNEGPMTIPYDDWARCPEFYLKLL